METIAGNRIVGLPSDHSVDETVQRLRTILEAKGVTLISVVDRSGEAGTVELKMPGTKPPIFGNSTAGTPLMLSAPSLAIDLPLKILVSEDGGARVQICYNSPEYLKQRLSFSR